MLEMKNENVQNESVRRKMKVQNQNEIYRQIKNSLVEGTHNTWNGKLDWEGKLKSYSIQSFAFLQDNNELTNLLQVL